MSFDIWLAFTAASIALLIIPGPTVLLVLSYALSQGKRVAVASALGVAAGDLIAMTVSILGLGAIMLTSALAFTIVKWIGAVYLIYMGVRMILSTRGAGLDLTDQATAATAKGVFSHAAIVTALNPKSIGFFVAFVPQFIQPAAPFAPQAAILIATFVGFAGLNALLFALAAGHMRHYIRRPAILTWITRTGGATLITMGIFTALLRRPAT